MNLLTTGLLHPSTTDADPFGYQRLASLPVLQVTHIATRRAAATNKPNYGKRNGRPRKLLKKSPTIESDSSDGNKCFPDFLKEFSAIFLKK